MICVALGYFCNKGKFNEAFIIFARNNITKHSCIYLVLNFTPMSISFIYMYRLSKSDTIIYSWQCLTVVPIIAVTFLCCDIGLCIQMLCDPSTVLHKFYIYII